MQRVLQAVFVFDCDSASSDVSSRISSLRRICTRILLSLSGFPNGTYMKCFKWKYVFFNQRKSASTKTHQFMGLGSCYIENMFKELQCELHSNALQTQAKEGTLRLLRSVLTDLVQRSTWDSPDIFSPQHVNKASGEEKQKLSMFSTQNEPLNLIFVFSDCLQHAEQRVGNVFTNDLFTCLLKQNISMFWVYDSIQDEVSVYILCICVCVDVYVS